METKSINKETKYSLLEYGIRIKDLTREEVSKYFEENNCNVEACLSLLDRGHSVYFNYHTITEIK